MFAAFFSMLLSAFSFSHASLPAAAGGASTAAHGYHTMEVLSPSELSG